MINPLILQEFTNSTIAMALALLWYLDEILVEDDSVLNSTDKLMIKATFDDISPPLKCYPTGDLGEIEPVDGFVVTGDGEAKLFAFAKTYSLNKGNAGFVINWLIKALAEISEVVKAYDKRVINVGSTGLYFGYSMWLFDRVIWKLRAPNVLATTQATLTAMV